MDDITNPAYRILYRILAVASGQHLVVVSAVPVHAPGDGSELRSESRLFTTAEIAATECAQMVAAMRARLLADGHDVSDAELA